MDEIKVEEPIGAQRQQNQFQISVPIAELKTRSIFLAVPMYGGMCCGMFAKSAMDLSVLCARYGINMQAYFLFNESLITRARNYCCDEFMRSDMTHMMFIDSDIGFDPNNVIALLAMQDYDPNGSLFRQQVPDDCKLDDATKMPALRNEKGELVSLSLNQSFKLENGIWYIETKNQPNPYDVIGAPYPKKCISWEKIKMAVDKGFADENPNNLENFVGDYVFNPKSGSQQIPIGQPVEVAELGTGFMMVRKNTLQVFKEAYPQYSYKPDHVRTKEFDGSREIHQFFQAEIDLGENQMKDVSAQYSKPIGTLFENIPDSRCSKRYLSEDYWHCYKLQRIGLKTWLCPWMQLHHAGTYVFGGSLAHLAQIGASATADPSQLKRK